MRRLRRVLAFFGGDLFDRGRELCMDRRVNRPVLDLGARRVLSQEIIALPVSRRSDRPVNKAATAIRTNVTQHVVDARGAKRALIATDAPLERLGWQRLVAVLAGRSEFKHTRLEPR